MQQNPALFESLFKRKMEEPASKNFVEEIATAHPYFSPAQFYLLQQTTHGTDAFNRQAAKTNIFFNNPLWLNFQLQQTKPGIPVQEKQYAEPIHESTVTEIMHEPAAVEEPEPMKEEPVIEQIAEPEVRTEPEKLEEEPPVAGINNEPVVTEETETMMEEFRVIESNIEVEIKNEPVPVIENSNEQEISEQTEIEPMKIELKLPEEKDTNGELPLFEPMHMVDYFASQGIKLSEEIQTGDKLGKQLKSFTEWLKTMKKIHSVSPAEETVQPDKSVEAMAELSNRENEVITEAMAEVFARQGKLGKATEVYQKLSLLNPAKSAYFAAKIDNLKGV